MTSFFMMTDLEGKYLHAVVNPINARPITSVYWDGFYFWFADNTNFLSQVWLSPEMKFHEIKTIDIGSIIGNAGTNTIKGIVGDGLNLYVACDYAFGTPVAVQRYTILKIDKNANVLYNYTTTTIQAPQNSYRDLAFDGHYLYAPYSDGGGGANILRLDVQRDKQETVTVTTLPQSIDFDGMNFIATNGTTIYLMNRDYDFMHSLPTTSARSFKAVTKCGDWMVGVA